MTGERMRGRVLDIGWRDEDTSEALKKEYLAERDGIVRTRLHALWLLRTGWPLGVVATTVGTHYRSVQRWIAWYRQGGISVVRTRHAGGVGQVARLSRAAQRELGDAVAQGQFRTAREIQEWIATRHQVSYALGGVYSLLERLRCAPKVPRPLHAKTDEATQEAWKKGASGKRSALAG
jgi:transposase